MTSENYLLNLDRIELCDLMLSCTAIIIDARKEMEHDPNCSEYRRKNVLPGTIRKWQTLHDKIKKQLEIQDAIRENEN